MVRGVVTLAWKTGKTKRVLVLSTPDKEAEAKEAGANSAGLDEYIQKIRRGWTDIDVNHHHAGAMGKVCKLGKVHRSQPHAEPEDRYRYQRYRQGRERNKAGKIDFKVDKGGHHPYLRWQEAVRR